MPPVDFERRDLLTEMALPDELALHVEHHELPGAEPRIHELSVADRARGSQVVFVVHSGERSDGFEAVLPQTTPTDSVERFHEEEGPLARRSRLCRTSRAQGTFAGLGGVGSGSAQLR